MSLEQDREQLADILRRVSVRRGEEFVLASGRRSGVYVDARVTTLRAEAMPLIGRLFLAKMNERGWRPAAVGGLTMGADPIVASIARESLDTSDVVDAFIVRKEAKKHGTQKRIEGLASQDPIDVVVVEDVATTGGSAGKAIEACREAGFRVLGAISLVDREEG
ncbi:MAG: orotate phosphoribosyltransferase, partial [bacterium]|nr:orotate phosphoribosyltransferase [bacterium]